VVWWGGDGIYRWDGSTTTKIPGTSASSSTPDVWGSNIVWYDSNHPYQIYLWDGNAITQITNDNSRDNGPPQVSSGGVVWSGSTWPPPITSQEVFLWDGVTTAKIADGWTPAISGSNIVWQADAIYFWDQISSPLSLPLSTHSRFEFNIAPRVSGSWVVWQKQIPPDSLIYLWDGTGTRAIAYEPSYAIVDANPDISGKRVVWERYGYDGADSEIFLWDGDTEQTFQLTCNDAYDRFPRISGSRVVWLSNSEIVTALLP
jgi:hypothetical protein